MPEPRLCEPSRAAFSRVRAWVEDKAAALDRPLLVGIGGPGGSGKSTLTRWLLKALPDAAELALDDFRLSREARAASGRYGSHPEGNDLRRLERVLEDVKAGRPVHQPVFDRGEGRVIREVPLPPARIVLADGELASHDHLRRHFDHLILVDAHWRTQLNTRLTRDLRERGCSLEKAIHIFLESNLRDYPRHAASAGEEAEVVLYRTAKHRFVLRRLVSV